MTTLVGVSKFKNINGVSCYMNSILHILQHIKPFLKLLFSKTNNKKKICDELLDLLIHSFNNEDISIIPTKFRNIIGMVNSTWIQNEQQDSHEFLIFLSPDIGEVIYLSNLIFHNVG